jgi:hypothetical protein
MRISALIAELTRMFDAEGDLVVVHFSADKHWEPVQRLKLHPAGRPHGRRRNVHAEKVVELGDET